LVKNLRGERTLGKPRRRWEVADWIHLPQDRDERRTVMKKAMNLRVP